MDQKKMSVFVAVIVVLVILIAGSVYLFNKKGSETATPTNTEVLSDTDKNVFDEFVQEQEITLSPGGTGTFDGLSITFNKVTEDNRCPTSVQCIVAGRVVGEFTLKDANQTKTALISSDAAEPYSFTDYFIEIKEVKPIKVNPGNLDAGSYEIVLTLSRNAKL